jgi:antitoxin ParD1/3/4
MPIRSVVLTDHHEEVIEGLVRSGRYRNASEVLRDGLNLVEQREALEAAKLVALQEAARTGFGDIEHCRYRDVTDRALEKHVARLGRQASNRVRLSGK